MGTRRNEGRFGFAMTPTGYERGYHKKGLKQQGQGCNKYWKDGMPVLQDYAHNRLTVEIPTLAPYKEKVEIKS